MSDGGETKNTAVSVKVSVGKEIDKSLGGALTALLMPGATEIGNLIGDGIGMLADIVNAKRKQNAQDGLESVREKLESADIDLKDVTPPKAEELHLLINGLSLADDANVRDLWAGLFAKAIDPSTPITAERAYLSVLQSLSPRDAQLIDLIGFAARLEKEVRAERERMMSQRLPKQSRAEKRAALDAMDKALVERCSAGIQHMQDAAGRHGLAKLKGENWSANLMRQGIIERTPLPGVTLGFSPRSFEDIQRRVVDLDQLARWNATDPEELFSGYGATPEMFAHLGSDGFLEVRFTKFGRDFAVACGLL